MTRKEFVDMVKTDIPDISGIELWIWGTGNTAELYQEGLERLKSDGLFISGYCDNNSDKWGMPFHNYPIISPDELAKKANILVLICTPNPDIIKTISKQLRGLNLEYRLLDELIIKLHSDDFISCYDAFYDDESKEVYSHLCKCKIEGKNPDFKYYKNDQYFSISKFCYKTPKEVFVDCGAYVGDSIESYIYKKAGVFGKIISFEPDLTNVKSMETRVERLCKEWNIDRDKIEIYPFGVSDKSENMYISRYSINNGFGSKLVESNDSEDVCKVISLDDFFDYDISFLKADIESYEYKMLIGAEKLIKKCKPLCAISFYHNIVDFYQIPLLLKKFVPNYKLAVRHHSPELDDTIVYAWID